MKIWMNVMRELETVMADYERLFDAWEAGGVRGLVVGPMVFHTGQLDYGAKYRAVGPEPCATFDPDPTVYATFGVDPPPPPSDPQPEQRRRLERMLQTAKERGWRIWLFTPAVGMTPAGSGPLLCDERAQASFCARTIDTLRHYPMADGGVMDGPEWGYEIAPHHMNHRSSIFRDLPESAAAGCARLGYDYSALAAARDRLHDHLHHLDSRRIAVHAGGGWVASGCLFGDPDLAAWLQFRVAALTDFCRTVRGALDAHAPEFGIGMGPRSACFAPLCGYDLVALAEILDLLLPKLYIWQRGFDGLYGTVFRYVETLTDWNPGLTDTEALAVVKELFGLALPEVGSRYDLDRPFPQAFFDEVVYRETLRPLAATGDPGKVSPWVEGGRRPHDGDPVSAGDLDRLLEAAERAGLTQFVYHHAGNLTPAEWTVLSRRCGTAWSTLTSDYQPPDEAVL